MRKIKKKKRAKTGLTDRQEKFCREYLIDLNATGAARRAGYSTRTCRTIGAENLTKPDIRRRIKNLIGKRSDRLKIKGDDVLRMLTLIARANISDLVEFGPGGVELKDSKSLPRELSYLVAEVSQTVTKHGGSQRLKMHDKIKAMDLLGRHLGLWGGDEESSGPPVINIEVRTRSTEDG